MERSEPLSPARNRRTDELEAFRSEASRALDWAADYLANSERYPVLSPVSPGDIRELLPESPPEKGVGFESTVEEIQRVIVPGATHWNSPGFMAYFGTTASPPGILGELYTAVLNQNALVWQASPAITEVEPVILDWLRQMVGLPAGWFAITYDTASISTLCGVAAAREAALPGVGERGLDGSAGLRMYASEESHSVVDKAAMILGIGRDNVVKIATDEAFRMVPERLEAAIQTDLAANRKPFCVVATVGTTASTAVDPVGPIAEIRREHGIWLHVDAAYGGSAAILPEMRWIFDGVEKADSLCLNPHKWLAVPVDLSAFFTRRPGSLKRAFTFVKPYLETDHDESVVNLTNYGPQLGRRFRGLKLWLVIRAYGVEGLQAMIRRHIELARDFECWVDGHSDFELLAPRHFSTVCYRANPAGVDPSRLDELNRGIMTEVNASGRVFISLAVLRGQFTLRMAIGNMWTETEHVDALKQELERAVSALT